MDITKLLVYDKYGENEKVVNIPSGAMFFGRGDLIYAGAAYETDNDRIHYYLDVKGNKRNAIKNSPDFLTNSLPEKTSNNNEIKKNTKSNRKSYCWNKENINWTILLKIKKIILIFFKLIFKVFII